MPIANPSGRLWTKSTTKTRTEARRPALQTRSTCRWRASSAPRIRTRKAAPIANPKPTTPADPSSSPGRSSPATDPRSSCPPRSRAGTGAAPPRARQQEDGDHARPSRARCRMRRAADRQGRTSARVRPTPAGRGAEGRLLCPSWCPKARTPEKRPGVELEPRGAPDRRAPRAAFPHNEGSSRSPPVKLEGAWARTLGTR